MYLKIIILLNVFSHENTRIFIKKMEKAESNNYKKLFEIT